MSRTSDANSQTKVPFSANGNIPKGVTDEVKNNDENAFSDEIWQQCLQSNIPQKALDTAFIKGIQNGNLKPDQYAQFMVQDAAYLQHGSENWIFAAQIAKQQNKSEIEQYCLERGGRWLQYAEGLSKTYHVKLDGIIIGRELKEYMDYESYIISKYGAEYAFVVFYACVKLWPFISNNIQSLIDKGSKAKENQINNVYECWIKDNSQDKSAIRTEKWLNKLYEAGKIDKEISLEIVTNCLKLEINFFKQACGEIPDALNLYTHFQASSKSL